MSEEHDIEDPYRYGACQRCLTPKPSPDCPDLCKSCEDECDWALAVANGDPNA